MNRNNYFILDVPSIITPPLTSIIMAGHSHNFTCKATGHPTPNITWTYKMVSVSLFFNLYMFIVLPRLHSNFFFLYRNKCSEISPLIYDFY